MTDPTIAALAGKLTAKQVAALLASRDEWLTSKQIGAAGSTLRSLCWFWPRGADPCSPCHCFLSRDYMDQPLSYIYRLTDLGKRLAHHLRTQGGE